MADGQLSPFHQEQLDNFLRFARFKRERHLKDIQATFNETKDVRLVEDTYSTKDVEQIIDGLGAVVKADVQKELLHVAHTMALVLRQMFVQAETIMFDLHADVTQLENERMLKEMAQFEESSVQREKDPKKNLSTLSKPSDAALKHNIQKLQEQNQTYSERFQKMQQQTIDVLKEKTAMGERLEKAKAELSRLQAMLEEKGEKVEINLEYTTHEKLSAEKKVSEAVAENESLKKQLKDSQDQLTKKVNETAPFLNMKKMLVKKNADIKHLREQLAKFDPQQFADNVKEED